MKTFNILHSTLTSVLLSNQYFIFQFDFDKVFIFIYTNMSKRKRISADQAVQNILQFVYEDSDEEKSDMDQLYAEEDFEDNDCIGIDTDQSPTRNVSSNDEIVEALTERRKHRNKLFLTKAMIENIVNYTNKRINKTLEKVGQEVIQTRKYPHVKIVDATDIYALIGLMYMRGLYGLNKRIISLLFC